MIVLDSGAIARTWGFLGAIAAVEAMVILSQWHILVRVLSARPGTTAGWILAVIVAIVAILYTAYALDLWQYLTIISRFRILGPIVAIPSALLEEAVFRLSLMNWLAHERQSLVVQVLASAIAFGLVHAIWALRGGLRSLLTATAATALLGALFAIVFLVSGRSLLPCVFAHFLFNVILEPWLAYAYALRQRPASTGR